MSTRIGFIGAGVIAELHARSLALSGLAVHAAYDIDPARAVALGAHPCGSVDELIDSSDAVWVLTPTRFHLDAVQAVAAAGKPVFCEKPLSVDLESSIALHAAASVVPNQVGLVLRSYGGYQRMVELATQSAPVSVVARIDMPGLADLRRSWRGDVELAGGGILIELAFHDIDLLLWAMGPVEAVSCITRGGRIEDVASLSLRFASGAIGTLHAVWHDAEGGGFQRSMEIFCEDRWIGAGPTSVEWRGVHGDGESTEAQSTNPDAAFVRCIETGEMPTPTVDDALAVHRVVDAAYRSAAAGGAMVPITE